MGIDSKLERIAQIDEELDSVRADQKRLQAERDNLERLAVEDIQMLPVRDLKITEAGRTWWLDESLHVSCSKDMRDAVLEAARTVGIKDELTTVQTTTLKAWLVARAREAGREAGSSFVAGTPFEGLISEYTETKLRHRKCS